MKKKYLEFPTEWDELQQDEWLYLVKCFCRMMDHQKIKLIDVKREWVRYVLKFRYLKEAGNLEYYRLVNKLVNTLDWVFIEGDDGNVSLNFTTTKNLLYKWENLVGPADHGADLTFAEFRTAVQMMNAYTMSGNQIYLHYMAAVLYRKARHGERQPFRADKLNELTFHTARIPFYVLYAMYAWLASFCAFLIGGTFVIDGKDVSFAEIFSGNGADEGDRKNLGMNSILLSIAESGVFGTADQVEQTQLLRVLLKLLDDKYKSDEIQKMIKKHDTK